MLTKPVVEKIWSQYLQTFEGHSASVLSIAFSSDGSRIASGSFDTTIRIWDAKSGKEFRKLEGHSDLVWSVAFSPDGSRIASGSSDKTICIWDTKSGEVRKLKGHSDLVSSVAFSPDGSRIASGSSDKTIRIWDAKSGKEVRSVNTDRIPSSLRFEDSGDSGLWLRSSAGSIKLAGGGSSSHDSCNITGDTFHMIKPNDQLTSNPQTPFSKTGPRWDLSSDGSWVTWRGQGTMWLPPDFRPVGSDVSRDGSAIVIGCLTGRVVVLRMSLDVSFP